MTDVTGKSFPQLGDELVFVPLGIALSTLEEPLARRKQIDAALPYDSGDKEVDGAWRVDPEMAPAGLWTTPSDLARFAVEVQKAYAGEPN